MRFCAVRVHDLAWLLLPADFLVLTVNFMGVWPPVVVFQEETTNRCMLLISKELVVNDTFKRQFQLSGADTGDDRKGTVDEASKSN